MISSLEIPLPIEYLKTGDHALLVAWHGIPPMFFIGGSINKEQAEYVSKQLRAETKPRAILCLEDGSVVDAGLDEIKFDYRYDIKKGKFVDVSGFGGEREDDSADTDQAAPDDGSSGVS